MAFSNDTTQFNFARFPISAMPKAGNLMHTHAHLNPITAPAYEISRLKSAYIHACKQYS